MTSALRQLAEAKFVLLTTYRKDGSAVATPLWATPEHDTLLMWTVADSYKVKRIARNPSVTVCACDARGNPQSQPIDAIAEILDAPASNRARRAIARRYGIVGWILTTSSRIRRGKSGTVGIALTAA